MGHLPILATRWDAPISTSIYAPGTDFTLVVDSIGHIRACHPAVKRWISFHLIFDQDHDPSIQIPNSKEIVSRFQKIDQVIDCLK